MEICGVSNLKDPLSEIHCLFRFPLKLCMSTTYVIFKSETGSDANQNIYFQLHFVLAKDVMHHNLVLDTGATTRQLYFRFSINGWLAGYGKSTSVTFLPPQQQYDFDCWRIDPISWMFVNQMSISCLPVGTASGESCMTEVSVLVRFHLLNRNVSWHLGDVNDINDSLESWMSGHSTAAFA